MREAATLMSITALVCLLLMPATTSATEDEFPEGLKIKDEAGRYLFGTVSTTTYTLVSQVTSTVYMSCLSGTYTVVCQGRNSRKLRKPIQPAELEDMEPSIDLEPSESEVKVENNLPNDDAKFGFTIWTTTKTTTSVTVRYTNTSSTMRMSYYCLAGGIKFPETKCVG